MTKKPMTQRELLVRIDERQQQIQKDVTDLKHGLLEKVSNDSDYRDLHQKVAQLWDWKNKMIGYAAGAGAFASLLFRIFEQFVFK